MNGWNDYTMKQEQYRDQLREAERHRLAKLVEDCDSSVVWHTIRNLVSRITKVQPTRVRVPCGEPTRPAEQAL